MNTRHLISAAAIALLSVAASAATLIVPAAGTGPGASGSHWQSELTLHNAAPRAASIAVTFHQGATVLGPVTIDLAANQTRSIADIARTSFGIESGTGALVLEVADRSARSLAVTSRTFNTSTEGEFGQDVPAVNVTDAVRAGDLAALPGPSAIEGNRFNFGLYAIDALNVTWELLRADGTIAATRNASYVAGEHAQYGTGIQSFFNSTPAANDTVQAHVNSGRAVFYGSIINGTGDPSFVPGVRTRDDVIIQFAGVDLDENGTIDIADADGDGVLDAPITMYTSMFPEFFRVVASSEFGDVVTYEIVSSPATKSDLMNANGTIRLIAAGDLKNTSGEMVVKVISGVTESLVTIPVQFK